MRRGFGIGANPTYAASSAVAACSQIPSVLIQPSQLPEAIPFGSNATNAITPSINAIPRAIHNDPSSLAQANNAHSPIIKSPQYSEPPIGTIPTASLV